MASRNLATLGLNPCGTPAAYERHRRRGENPCQRCREARSRRDMDRYREMRDAAGEESNLAAIKKANDRHQTRTVQLPGGTILLGHLAATEVLHPHIPDAWTGTTCLACFGWCCDYRHLGRAALAGAVA